MKSKAKDVAALVDRLSHCASGHAYRGGLKPAQWSALRYLDRANRFSRSISAYARYQGLTSGAASQTMTMLVDKGLVRRHSDPHDRRRHTLELTETGRRLLKTDPIAELVSAAGELGDDQQSETIEALETMLSCLLSREEGGRFGICGRCRYLSCDASGRYLCSQVAQSLASEELDQMCVNFERGSPRLDTDNV